MPDRDASRYRRKYLELVDELDRKEKEWAEIDQRLRRILAHLTIVAEGPSTPEVSAVLGQIRDGLKDGVDLGAVEEALEKLRDRVLRETRWADGSAELPPVHEVLIHLVERLPIPPDLAQEALAVVERLEPGISPDDLPEAIEAVAGLAYRVQARIQEEKRELEALLRDLAARLQEIDRTLLGTWEQTRAGFEASRSLDAVVREEIKGLEEQSTRAPDMEALRASVHEALDAIRTHLEAYRRAEEERESALEAEVEALRKAVSRLEQEVEEHREQTRRARELSTRDPLTGAFNRLAYQERARAEEARWRRYGAPLSLIILDVDRFKAINDSFGHRAGDLVLRTIAQLVGSRIREVDFFARYGGEEFVILLPETPLAAAREVAEKVRRSVEAFRFHARGKRIPITISCGVAQLREGDTVEAAFERADAALYRAKGDGRNRTVTEGDGA